MTRKASLALRARSRSMSMLRTAVHCGLGIRKVRHGMCLEPYRPNGAEAHQTFHGKCDDPDQRSDAEANP